MATKYEIPRLENDVIVTLPLINPELTRQPHLFNLPLHPFDVFTYGKVYSIPLLARHNESHVLAHFSEYIDRGHFKKLILRSPDPAVDLVKSHLHHSHLSNSPLPSTLRPREPTNFANGSLQNPLHSRNIRGKFLTTSTIYLSQEIISR